MSIIRKANPGDIDEINRVILAAKRHWGYSEEWMDLFQSDLLKDADFLTENILNVLESDGRIVGLYSLSRDDTDLEIEDMWVLPDCMNQGHGRALWDHLLLTAYTMDGKTIRILSDPNAEGFYLRMGAVRTGQTESVIPGRFLPVLRFDL